MADLAVPLAVLGLFVGSAGVGALLGWGLGWLATRGGAGGGR